jgi:hypothetical protein
MKINELRIGNIINRFGKEYTVTLETFNDLFIGNIKESDLSPIDIVDNNYKEWLGRFGFKHRPDLSKKDDNLWLDDFGMVFELGCSLLGNYDPLEKEKCDLVRADIIYVHEFQNVYFDSNKGKRVL